MYGTTFSLPLSLINIIVRSWNGYTIMGHFRIVFACVKTILLAKSFKQVLFHANQTYFHKKSFARRLVLKQRRKVTRNWPI